MGDFTFYYLIKHNIDKRTLVRYCIYLYHEEACKKIHSLLYFGELFYLSKSISFLEIYDIDFVIEFSLKNERYLHFLSLNS